MGRFDESVEWRSGTNYQAGAEVMSLVDIGQFITR